MSVKVMLIKDKPIGQFVVESDITTIGRKSECDISIKDPAVSGSHAQIHKLGKNYVIEDLGSTNGVVYKGRKVKQQILKHDDLVSIGEHQLKFLITGGSVVETRPRTLVTSSSPEQVRAQLVMLDGPDYGKKISLEDGLTTVGIPSLQVAAVSRRPQGHFIIHVDGGKDKDRVPLLNGDLTGFKSHKLEHKDKIEVADVQMEYRMM